MENIGKLIPILFEANETNFLHNGIGRLNNLTKNEVVEVLNGEFELELEYPVIEDKYSLIKDSMLILAKPNRVDEPHLFRIYEHNLTSDNDSLLIKARTINADLASNVLSYLKLESVTPEDAMLAMKAAALNPCDFTFSSDITTTSSTIWSRRNLLNCIAGEEGSLIQYWGGEIKHLNKHIILYKSRGRKDVTTIRHGKNLKGLQVLYSIQNVITEIIPYYVIRNEEEDTELVVVGSTVQSQYITNYPHPHTVFMEFTVEEYGQKIEYEDENGNTVTETYMDLDILNEAASNWFFQHSGVDLPEVNLSAEIEDLSQMEDYEKFKELEKVNLGDSVTIYSEKYKVNITAKVIKIIYDGLTDKLRSVELGDKLFTGYQQYKEIINRTVKPLQVDLNNVMIAANKKNKIFRGPNEPTHSMTKNDIWYKPVGEGEVELYRFDGVIWRIEKVSGGLIQGTLDAGSGDLDIINLNASNITTGSLDASRIILSNDTDLETALEQNLIDIQDSLSEQESTLLSYISDLTLDASEINELKVLKITTQLEVDDILNQIENDSDEASDLTTAADDLIGAINQIIITNEYVESDFSDMLTKFNLYTEAVLAAKIKIKSNLKDLFTELQTQLEDLENDISTYKARLLLTNNDITMTVNGIPVMKLSQHRLSFFNEGEEVSYFSGQRMMIDNALVLKKLQVGNHSIERQGSDYTVFRWVGSEE